MFQGRSSVLVVINYCVGCWRQCSIAFTLHVFTPFYCRQLTRWTGAVPTANRDAQAAGSIGMPPSVSESDGLRSASPIWLGRECSGSERIGARIIEVGFSIAPILGAAVRIAPSARGDRCACPAWKLFPSIETRAALELPTIACFAALYYYDLSYKCVQSRSRSRFEALWSTAADARCIQGGFGRCRLICRRGVRW